MLAGPPEGIEHLGGEDFDEAVFSRVLQVIGSQADDLAASNDPATMAAVAELRRQCVVAKELLSTEPTASIDVSLPGLEVTIRVTRQEFEWMIRPALTDTMRAFSRALRNAKVSSDDLAAVVLVGGSVRIPLVAETVTRSVSCPVMVPVDPVHSVALGAAMAAARYRIPRNNAAQARTRSRITKSSAEPSSSAPPPQREATIAARELLRLGRGEQARLAGWLVRPGSSVAVGQPLGRVAVTGGEGGGRTALLRSPFEGVVHRYFAEPGAVILRDHLLVSYRQVAAYLTRPGRALPTDTGVLVKINPPTTTTAFTGRPVIFVDRVPRTLW
jgi:molecular chaperone DnaK